MQRKYSEGFRSSKLVLVAILLLLIPVKGLAEGCALYAASNMSSSNLRIIPFPGNENFRDHMVLMAARMTDILELDTTEMPAVAIIDDRSSKNAYAVPHSYIRSRHILFSSGDVVPKHSILFGGDMLWDLAFPSGPNILRTNEIAVVLAHEYGHIMQFHIMDSIEQESHPRSSEYKILRALRYGQTWRRELMADMISGWVYANYYGDGLRKQSIRGDLQRAVRRMYSIGDFAFNNPDHHGTPKQRMNAFTRGMRLAIDFGVTDVDEMLESAFVQYYR